MIIFIAVQGRGGSIFMMHYPAQYCKQVKALARPVIAALHH